MAEKDQYGFVKGDRAGNVKRLNKIIDNMQKNNYTEDQINEYNKQRWNIYNEMYKVKKS